MLLPSLEFGQATVRKCQGSFSNQGVWFMSNQIHTGGCHTHSALW